MNKKWVCNTCELIKQKLDRKKFAIKTSSEWSQHDYPAAYSVYLNFFDYLFVQCFFFCHWNNSLLSGVGVADDDDTPHSSCIFNIVSHY